MDSADSEPPIEASLTLRSGGVALSSSGTEIRRKGKAFPIIRPCNRKIQRRRVTIKPRWKKAALPHEALPEVISPYLIQVIQKTGGKKGPVGLQFVAQPKRESQFYQKQASDPLDEEKFIVAPGLVYKYRGKIDQDGRVVRYGRALWLISNICSSYCRFCTRGRQVGRIEKPFLTDEEIKKTLAYIALRPELNEIILSGGDPLVAPKAYLKKIIGGLAKLQKKGPVEIVRIGTRLPIHNPGIIKDWHYLLVGKIKNPYLMIHVNHLAELTNKTIVVLNRFRKRSSATIMSQTVLLKGVNDSVETLWELFNKMAKEGIRPYYLFSNDPVYWARHFTVPFEKAIKIWQKLRPLLSGVAATARFIIDVPFGFGKVAIPEGGSWKIDYDYFYDFRERKYKTKEATLPKVSS